MSEFKTYMTGWSNSFLDPIFLFQSKLEKSFGGHKILSDKLDFRITFESPPNIDKLVSKMEYFGDNMIDYIDEFR